MLGVDNNGALSNDQRQQSQLPGELSTTEADNAVHTYAAATAHVFNHGSGDHRRSFRDAVAAAVCIDRRTKERRAKSVVIAGLTPNTEVSDVENVINLCGNELNIIPAVKYARRLGTAIEGRVHYCLCDYKQNHKPAKSCNELGDYAHRTTSQWDRIFSSTRT